MWELIFPEALIALFLILPLIRPLVKNLWAIDGLTWLPFLALGITIGLFPAYGFRPECVPLLIYVIVFNICNIPAVLALLSHLQNDDFRERSPVIIFLSIALLVLVM